MQYQVSNHASKCVNCGAPLPYGTPDQTIQCGHCGVPNRVIVPVAIDIDLLRGLLDRENFERLAKIIRILEKAIEAENWDEAYGYCNKSLEITSDSADLWAQKAYVSFWRSMHSSGSQKLVATNAKEILVYLREAFQIDSGAPVLQDLADRIAHGLWVIAHIRYRTIAENASDSEGNFPLQALEDASQCLDLMDTAWEVAWHKDPNWLHFVLLQFNNYGKIAWSRLQNNQVFDNTQVLTGISWRQNQLVQKIRMVSPNYVPPPPQHPPFNWTGAITVVLVIIILIAYAASK